MRMPLSYLEETMNREQTGKKEKLLSYVPKTLPFVIQG